MASTRFPSKPASFYRITDDTSLTRTDELGNFDTTSHMHMRLCDIINGPNLLKQLNWRHRFDLNGRGMDPPIFVSLTHNQDWAEREYARRMENGRVPRLYQISTDNLKCKNLELVPGERFPALVDESQAVVIFSSEAAAQSDSVQLRHRQLCGHEWFAVEYVPASMIRLRRVM